MTSTLKLTPFANRTTSGTGNPSVARELARCAGHSEEPSASLEPRSMGVATALTQPAI